MLPAFPLFLKKCPIEPPELRKGDEVYFNVQDVAEPKSFPQEWCGYIQLASQQENFEAYSAHLVAKGTLQKLASVKREKCVVEVLQLHRDVPVPPWIKKVKLTKNKLTKAHTPPKNPATAAASHPPAPRYAQPDDRGLINLTTAEHHAVWDMSKEIPTFPVTLGGPAVREGLNREDGPKTGKVREGGVRF